MGILTFCHCHVKMTSYTKMFYKFEFCQKIAPYAKFELDQVIILKIIQVSCFFQPKKLCDTLEAEGCYGNILPQWLLTKYVK